MRSLYNNIYSAPGHPFDTATGDGIRFVTGNRAELWKNHQRLDVAQAPQVSEDAFYHSLLFARTFPAVTHWWFGSPLTFHVRATTRAVRSDRTRLVWLQSSHPATKKLSHEDELLWEIPPSGAARGDMPGFAAHPANLPLRERMAAVAVAVASNVVPTNYWHRVNSEVAVRDLATLLPVVSRYEWLSALGLRDVQ